MSSFLHLQSFLFQIHFRKEKRGGGVGVDSWQLFKGQRPKRLPFTTRKPKITSLLSAYPNGRVTSFSSPTTSSFLHLLSLLFQIHFRKEKNGD
ncbi:hypothetical protein CDAR_301991 [Caerostris darwini]|uniref:Ycf15 n=1 Tax=Caerostris darwini TaxID=1538125 RepID=A0AAV4UH08_9ARAC|nr:hypothetical protein CDAR_301991 [Caerostris darwini]